MFYKHTKQFLKNILKNCFSKHEIYPNKHQIKTFLLITYIIWILESNLDYEKKKSNLPLIHLYFFQAHPIRNGTKINHCLVTEKTTICYSKPENNIWVGIWIAELKWGFGQVTND